MRVADLLPDLVGWKNIPGPPNLAPDLVRTIASRGYSTPDSTIFADVYTAVFPGPRENADADTGKTFFHLSCSGRSLKVVERVMRRFFLEGRTCLAPPYIDFVSSAGVRHVVCEVLEPVEEQPP